MHCASLRAAAARCLGVFLISGAPALAQSSSAPYVFTTLAGVSSKGIADGTGTAARFNQPAGVAIDRDGNIYVADRSSHTIRRVTPAGAVTTFAGSPGEPGSSDGTGTAARFNFPSSVAYDDITRTLFVSDAGNQTIRAMTTGGVVSTFAGVVGVRGATDGARSVARFSSPNSVAVDPQGNVFVADSSNSTIRRIAPDGMVSTLAGSPGSFSRWDGDGRFASFSRPVAVASGPNGLLYVTDQQLRKITPPDSVSTVNQGVLSFNLLDDSFLACDTAGNVYVTDSWNHGIVRVTPTGTWSTLVGGISLIGDTDGSLTTARFVSPIGIAINANGGNLYVSDGYNNNLRRITPTGEVSTLAGLSAFQATGRTDGAGAAARFAAPAGIAVRAAGDIFVADSTAHTIRKISASGAVSTVAGSSTGPGSDDGTGTAAKFKTPRGIAVDSSGNLYVADNQNHTIRKITPAGVVSTLAGMPDGYGYADGTGSDARFAYPHGIAVDAGGTVFVVDTGNAVIRKITPNGVVTTFAGLAKSSETVDGTGSAARFRAPENIAIDAAGNLYVTQNQYSAPSGPAVIRKISPGGVVTTVTISPDGGYTSSLTGYFSSPLAVDAAGNIYLGDSQACVIRKIAPDGTATNLAGAVGLAANVNGVGESARFEPPWGLARDSSGALYVASGTEIRKGVPAGAPVITTQPQNQTVSSGGSATFSVTASGAPAPTYQWYLNGNAISGATQSSYSASNAGEYTVVVTNTAGSVTSAKATLTVTTAPPPSSGGGSGGGGGGGGAISWWMLTALALLGIRSGFDRRRGGRPGIPLLQSARRD